jgi:hypothetical protein
MLMRESAHSGEDSKLNSPDDGETSLSSILATPHNQNPGLTRLSSENTTQASEEPASPPESKTALAKSTFKPREDEPEDEKSHGHLSTSAVSHILETDDDMALAEALGLYRSKSNVLADPIHPDIG